MTVKIDVSEMKLEEVQLVADDFLSLKFFFSAPVLGAVVLEAENSGGNLELANSASFNAPKAALALSSDSRISGLDEIKFSAEAEGL